MRALYFSCLLLVFLSFSGCKTSKTVADSDVLSPFKVEVGDFSEPEGYVGSRAVPPGITKEEYYGRGLLRGPDRKWVIESPYEFAFIRQEGDELYFKFCHHEKISHAFLTDFFKEGVIEPRNPGFDILDKGEWKKVVRGGCYFGCGAYLLDPGKEYVVKIYLRFRSRKKNDSVMLKAIMDTGCWLHFESQPFPALIPFEPEKRKLTSNRD